MNSIRPLLAFKGLEIDKSFMTYLMNVGQATHLDGYIWYIEGPREKIVVDTGGKKETFAAHGLPVERCISPREALREAGLTPEDVDIVIITHLHFDHVEQAKEYSRAKFIVQKAEWEYAQNPHPSLGGFFDIRSLEGLNVELVEGDCQIAEGVRVLLTPGHTHGGQSVAVETAKGIVVISGLCTIQENFEPPEEIRNIMPVIIPAIHSMEPCKAFDSLMRIKEIADIILPLQEPGLADKKTIP